MRFFPGLLFGLMLAACAPLVNVDFDKNADFKLFHTYRIDSKPVRVSQDTRVNSAFMLQRVVAALNTTLILKGYEKTRQQADIQIKYFLDLKPEMEIQESGITMGFGTFSKHSAIGLGYHFPLGEAVVYDTLVLTIDIISTKTNKLVWRGSLGYQLVDASTPETHNKLISALVIDILNKFPP